MQMRFQFTTITWLIHQKLIDSEVLKEDEKISLIAGGPPCPGFSLIGRSKISDLIKNKKGTDLWLGVDALGLNVYEKEDK
mgnify:CR=1 FL=1